MLAARHRPLQVRTARLPFLLLVLAALGLAWLVREAQHRRVTLADQATWITTDPDSLYQMRRVERVFVEGLPVAGSDAWLAWPDGSAIPWPPYYTLLSWGVLAPFAPDATLEGGEVLHDWIERSVASLPLVFGLLTVLLAALAGRAVGGLAGAWIAATYAALCGVAIAYSKSGNGDHHAFVSMCSAAVLLLLTQALDDERLERPRAAALLGALAGAVTGVQLGAWVGSLMHVVVVDLVLGWAVVQHARRPRPGLPWLGLAYHLTALLVLLPAVLASPWRATEPWMVVNLSWFHPAFLLAGAAVFLPLVALRARRVRAYPWIVLTALAVVGSGLYLTGLGPGRGLREALEWAGKENAFMSRVRESRSLFAADGGGGPFDALGYGVVLLPLAWGAMAWQAFVLGRTRLLPWVCAAAAYALGAGLQARFAEPLVVPLAVALGWGAARLLEAGPSRWLRGAGASLRAALLLVLALGLVAASHATSVQRTWSRLRAGRLAPLQMEAPERLAARHMAEWLRARGPSGPDEGVLADWGWGHVIEWAGARPTVATNFGLYVGEECFRDPSRFFLSEDPSQAEALLVRRRVGHVLLTSGMPDRLNSMVLAVAPSLRERYVERDIGSGGALSPAWFRTMGARLMFDGRVFGPAGEGERPIDFLRCVFVSALRDPAHVLTSPSDVSPAGWLWQRVAGARLEAHGTPGDVLEVRVVVEYPRAGRRLVWSDRALADDDGLAHLRLPYATNEPNGEGRVIESAWSFAGRDGRLVVPESAVLSGGAVILR